ncbi:hypothetical protein ABMA27_012785 [Loxostege sticticalis]|uniref:C2H2-type domain-containing protein n=1 Tax=Loxostege sticticalis TaxID=481309 RepID=A0ABR3GZT2_LOXSC
MKWSDKVLFYTELPELRLSRASYHDERIAQRNLRNLVAIIVRNSTIMPFRWSPNKFMCFYCCCPFNDVAELKNHTRNEHDNTKLQDMSMLAGKTRRVKLDVAEVSCKKCPKKLHGLNEFLDHVSSAHDVKINREASQRLLSFKLSDDHINCMECDESFKYFGTLLAHTHKYHNKCNAFLCEICGQGFASKVHVADHLRNCHFEGECAKCQKKFTSQSALRLHDDKVHRSWKCPKCTEVLGSRYLMKQHMALVHDVGNNLFKCDECDKVFVLRNRFLEHKARVHLKEKTVECPICGFKLFNKEMLKRHMVRHDDARPFECDICKRTFQRKKTLVFHRRIHTNDKRYVLFFTELPELRLSRATYHDERIAQRNLRNLVAIIVRNSTIMPFRWSPNKFMCFYCCCPFNDVAELKNHTRNEHENTKLQDISMLAGKTRRVKLDVAEVSCKKCPKKLHGLNEFLDHVSPAHDVKINREASKRLLSFKLSDDHMNCMECDESFKFFGTLLAHTHKYHNKCNAFLCEICGQGFISKAHVAHHLKNCHSEGECVKCQKKFTSQYALRLHDDKEHRSWKCPKCTEVLGSRYLRKRHMALAHDVGNNLFKCDECDKIFVLRNRFLEHKARVHLKEKTVECPICGFKLFNKEMLKRHMVRHDDARPFECDICKRTFQRKKTLVFHRRIHTNDKRYVCKSCGKSFVQVASLKLHIRVHHSSNESASWN